MSAVELEIGKIFESKYECFMYLKPLMSEENFKLINKTTNDIPLSKINHLLNQYNYVWVNIMDEFNYRNIQENYKYWIVEEDYHTSLNILKTSSEKVSFLFIKRNTGYEFLGIYQMIKRIKKEDETYRFQNIFQRVEQNVFLLNESIIKNIIEENSKKIIIECTKDKEKLKQLLDANIELFQYLPDDLKNREDFLLETANKPYGDNIKYAGIQIRKNKEFAKKFLKENGYASQYFSDAIKDDVEICRIACNLGYYYASENIRKNKQLALEVFVPFHMRVINKELRKDKDIIQAYWKEIANLMNEDIDYINTCSIIGVDDLGNEIIDEFLENEQKRHTAERVLQYEEQTELIQFIKTNKTKHNEYFNTYDFDKQLFDKKYRNRLIVLIGKEENPISKDIKEEYRHDKENTRTHFVEIYTQDLETDNTRLITMDKEQILDLLRILAYATSNDDKLSQNDGLLDIKHLLMNELKNSKIKTYKFKTTINELKKEIDKIPKEYINKSIMIQLICNDEYDEYTCMQICNMIFEKINNGKMIHHASHICNIDHIEIIILIKEN